MTIKRAGRPREFARDQALHAAVQLFWQRGYAATSLDELLGAMQIGKSSFYGSFGSKHGLLLECLALYTDELYATMHAALLENDMANGMESGVANGAPKAAVAALMAIAACTEHPRFGCFFINSAMELLPHDTAVAALARRHLGRVDKLFNALLGRCGLPKAQARQRSGALLALAAGAVALRKAGEPEARIRALLDLTPSLLVPDAA